MTAVQQSTFKTPVSKDSMAKLILFNKPYQVLSQFTDNDGRATLADHLPIKDAYPAGRLDYDSEGLLLLTDEGQLQHQISHPKHKLPKTYWVQVEGIPNTESIMALTKGVTLNDGPTLPAKVKAIAEPAGLWPRNPPIRQRDKIPTQWLQITITEGRNRQVRRMTAAVGHPTLRLIRAAIGNWQLRDLQPGDYCTETIHLASPPKPSQSKNNRHNSSRGRPTKQAPRNRKR